MSTLKEYKAKRDFGRTKEPAGKPAAGRKPLFVIQKHDATRLHYDFRLAIGGVLKSWAVPKGFPMKRGDRRLAVQVEDHPIEYARFEGTIPEGNYGAGTVMVWDIGSYQAEGGNPAEALEAGKLHLHLDGQKLKGEWTLVRMRSRDNEDKPQWLILKSGEDFPPLSSRAEHESALTRRTLERIAADNDAQWQSDHVAQRARTRLPTPPPRGAAPLSRTARAAHPDAAALPFTATLGKLPKRAAGFVEPMKARLIDALPRGSDWAYEVKFDGIRALAIKNGSRVQLLSRNEKDLSERFPEITDAVRRLPVQECVLDGEVAALDPQGRSSFQLLQAHQLAGRNRPPIFYYVFDSIQLNGRDLTGLPLLERKGIAQALLAGAPESSIRFSPAIRAESDRVLKEMQARGLEGLIAKRTTAKYEIGRRSGAWAKFKWTSEQEFVIGGYTAPKGSRAFFGAVLVGYYERRRLIFASKVGSGFDEQLLESLSRQFEKLVQPDCPFANLPEQAGAGGLTRAQMRRCTWLKPELVCQVRFSEWTRDGHLRQPAFLGLREDKQPENVVRESANQ